MPCESATVTAAVSPCCDVPQPFRHSLPLGRPGKASGNETSQKTCLRDLITLPAVYGSVIRLFVLPSVRTGFAACYYCDPMRFSFLKFGGSVMLFVFLLTGCMKYGPSAKEPMVAGKARGLFIINEGNFTASTASLSYYTIDSCKVENAVFNRVNAFRLGDVAQSMVIRDGLGYIVVNNSNVVFVIDVNTFERVGKITGLVSPRYIHFVNDEKAYITDLYSPAITVFDPRTLRITKRIPVNVLGKTEPSTEQMVQYKNFVFTNCWSYDNKILVIDTDLDKVVDVIEVGVQPTSLVLDKNNKLWTITDGGYSGSPYGYEAPALYKIDAETRTIEKVFRFKLGDSGSEICMNGDRDEIYFLNKHVWKMDIEAETLPSEPFIFNPTKHNWYGLTVDPLTSEIYLADAIDYSQPGVVYRYAPDGEQIDRFQVGIIPGAFCFKEVDDEE